MTGATPGVVSLPRARPVSATMAPMSLRHAAHAVWDCQYHLVWIPKRRRPVLQGEIAQRLGGLLEEIAVAYDIELVEMHIASDHVHLLCAIPPPAVCDSSAPVCEPEREVAQEPVGSFAAV